MPRDDEEGWAGVGGGREVQEEDICILVADLHCCVAKISTTLQSNYPPITNNFLFNLCK